MLRSTLHMNVHARIYTVLYAYGLPPARRHTSNQPPPLHTPHAPQQPHEHKQGLSHMRAAHQKN